MEQSHTPTRPDGELPAPGPWRLLAGLGSSCAAGIAMGKLIRGPLKRQVHTFDAALFAATRKIESPFMDRAMAILSDLGEPSLLYSLSGTSALIWLAQGKGRDSAALELAIVGSATIDKVTKAVIHRPRPYLKLPLARSRPSGSSFPSNHAMMSLATYGSIAALPGRRRHTRSAPTQSGTPDRHSARRERRRKMRIVLALTLFALVGWSRVYRGVHNPSDVIAGWIIGSFWFFVCYSWRGSVGNGRPLKR